MPPRDVVFTYSLETLDDSRARGFARPPGRMLQTLLSSPRVGRVLVVDAERWLVSVVRHGRSRWPESLGPARPHLRPWRWTRNGPTDPVAIERHVGRTDATIARAVRRHGLTQPALITFDPLLAGYAPAAWARAVTYYGRDDWAGYPPRRPWWPAYEEAYERLRATGRAVLAISEPLIERIGPTGPFAVVPNGIDPDEWRAPGPAPAWFAGLPRPILTYVGTVDGRVDERLVRQLLDLDGSVALVGPCADRERRDRLRAMGVVLGEAADRDEVGAIVHHSDVGLIPHGESSLTEAMSPLKLFEYRAAGLPVASVRLPPIAAEAAHDPRIVLAQNGPTGFADAARRALELGGDREADRQAYITRTSWTGRHEAALEVALR
jgi:glycosyltransferase involved in cell wall biosynthesis